MDPAQRIMPCMPLSWNQAGPLKAHRLKSLGSDEIPSYCGPTYL